MKNIDNQVLDVGTSLFPTGAHAQIDLMVAGCWVEINIIFPASMNDAQAMDIIDQLESACRAIQPPTTE